MPHLLGSCTPIIFSTQEFMKAYELGLEAQCTSEHPFMTEQELISEILQCLLERWDHYDSKPIPLEWSVGFFVGELHALFVPALAYVSDQGQLQYESEAQEHVRESTTDPLPPLIVASSLKDSKVC